MCFSVVKQKNSKNTVKLKLFLVPLAEPVCKAVFSKNRASAAGIFPSFPCMEGLEVPLLFTEGHFVSGGRSDLFSDISLLLVQSA